MPRTQEYGRPAGAYAPDPMMEVALGSELQAARMAGVVHDLGNLIQIASGAMRLIARRTGIGPAGMLGPLFARADAALDRAGILIRQTLLAARGADDPDGLVSIAECLSDVQMLLPLEPSIRLQVCVDPDLPPVRCSRLELLSAVLNLALNAREALLDGGAISVTAACVAVQGRYAIELKVSDNGVGMGEETKARAFDPFFTTKTQGLGGCGLPMVRRFAEAAGGHVAIVSERGLGATVTLTLPAADRL